MDAGKIFSGGVYRVAGSRLGPITLGHGLWLNYFGAIGCETPGQFALAAAIISRPWSEWVGFMGSRWFAFGLWLWARRGTAQNRMALRNMIADAVEPVEMMYAPAGGTSGAGGAPAILRLRVFLMEKHGAGSVEVMDRPLAVCMADAATSLELAGLGEVVTDEMRAQARHNTAQLTRN